MFHKFDDFVPVYDYLDDRKRVLRKHVYAVALACGKRKDSDPVSLVDFILHGFVTRRYTAYPGVRELIFAAIHGYSVADKLKASKTKPSVDRTPIE